MKLFIQYQDLLFTVYVLSLSVHLAVNSRRMAYFFRDNPEALSRPGVWRYVTASIAVASVPVYNTIFPIVCAYLFVVSKLQQQLLFLERDLIVVSNDSIYPEQL